MHEGNIRPIAQNCTQCGAGPWHPREEKNYDRYAQVTIVEAKWVCGRCGSLFQKGVIETIPDEKTEQEKR